MEKTENSLDRESLKQAWAEIGPPLRGLLRGRWLWVIVAIWALMTLRGAFVLVGAGERAIVFNQFTGTQPYQLGEGLHLLVPWVQRPTIYDVKTHSYTMSASRNEANGHATDPNDSLTALTSDGLPVSLDISILYHVDPDNVWKLHRDIGMGYPDKIVRPQTRSHVRMVVARYPVVDVYGSRRAKIIEEINTRLKELFAQNYLVLDEALLRDVRFSEEFQQAIEQKQVAQQEVQQMQFVLERVEKERQRKIIEAEGEAESIRLKAAALTQNPKLIEYEYVKRLPDNVRTVVTDGRTIVNLGNALQPEAAAAAAAASEGR